MLLVTLGKREGGKLKSKRGRIRPNKEAETLSQQTPNPVQGGLSQFLSWIENNSLAEA